MRLNNSPPPGCSCNIRLGREQVTSVNPLDIRSELVGDTDTQGKTADLEIIRLQ